MKKSSIRILLAVAPLMFMSSEAHACGACVAAVNSASSAITGAVSSAASTIVQAITMATGQISQELEKQMIANEKTQEANVAWQTQRDLEQKRVEMDQRTYARAPNICNTMNVARRVSSADQDARGEAVAQTERARQRNMGTEAVTSYLNTLFNKHTNDFASLNGADVRADVMFAPTNANGRAGLTYNQKQQDAADFFSGLVVNPLPTPKIPQSMEATPQGKAYSVLQMAQQARLSMADFSLSQIQAGYKPSPGMGQSICQSWNDLYARSGSTTPPPACNLNPDASLNEVMDFMVTSRMSPAWTKMLTSSAPEGVMREQASMMAFKLYMDYKNYQQMERMEGMMAAGVAMDTDSNMRGMLAAQRVAAGAAVGRNAAAGR